MTAGKGLNLTLGAVWFDNGVLVEPHPGAFARALEEFARSPERITEMGRSARAFASACYPQEVLISNLDSLYRELLARNLPDLDTVPQTLSTQV
jgi:glycosyltransferase involved in cell wall biosynthesis